MKLLKKFYRLFRAGKQEADLEINNNASKAAKSFFNNLYSSDDDIGYC